MALKPQTYAELGAISGLGEVAVREWIKALRAAPPAERLVFIGDWREDALGRRKMAAFALALGASDMARPPAKTRAQITADYRARKALA